MQTKRFLMLLGLAFTLFSYNAAAQGSFLGRLQGKQKSSQGTVVVHQSKEIADALMGKSAAVSRPASGGNSATENNSAESAEKRNTGTTPATGNETSGNTIVSLSKHVAKNKIKSNGYRIQVFSGGNSRSARQEAQRMAVRVKNLFPELPIYTHFYNPHWVCRVGDFRTYEEASAVLRQMKQGGGFREAIVIKSQILKAL
ncbi:MAG: SPOR domain-containing protein [Bacteroidaceae bacterium]|nr:SPOR domain-containing protein [Bacteroidaceae bacterium]